MRRIVDNGGVWVTNVGHYPMQDPHSGARIEVGETVKVPNTKWVANQLTHGCLKQDKEEMVKAVKPSAVEEPVVVETPKSKK